MRIAMLNHGLRNVQAGPSGPARAKSEIGILAVQKEALIEQADFIQHRAAVQGGRTTGKERFFLARVGRSRFHVTALLAAAIARQKHAGRIQAIGAREPHLRSTHTTVRPIPNRGHQRSQPARMRDRVVVQDREKRRLRRMKGLVHGRSEANVAIVANDPDTLARFHSVLAAVVYHDHFKVIEGLALQRRQAFVEGFVRSQSRNNHGHRRVDWAGPGFSYHRRLCKASL